MREVKFRGKNIETKEWVYGWLIKGENTYIITPNDFYNSVVSIGWLMSTSCVMVIPDTVDQYTGLKDSDDTEIYEGDVVVVDNEKYDVLFDEGIFYLHHLNGEENECVYIYESLRGKIIGNIHEK